jgi:hypothetical protein
MAANINREVCPTEALGLLMSSVCKINALLVGRGCGGEGNARGARAVGLKQGTCEGGNSPPWTKDHLSKYEYFLLK